GIDPKVLVVVAARGAAEAGPGFAAVDGAHGDGAGDVNNVGILRVHLRNRQVATADSRGGPRIIRHLRPARAGTIGSIDAELSRAGSHCSVKATGLAGRDGNVDLCKVFRQAVRKLLPGVAAIGRLEK